MILKITDQHDLENVMALWKDKEVMMFVGFANGLEVTMQQLENWLKWTKEKQENRRHFSIYDDENTYCGESFYDILENGYVVLDIKLFKKARGKGIAYWALKETISQAFEQEKAQTCYVDPHKSNDKAIVLYEKIGFIKSEYPAWLAKDANEMHQYMYLDRKKFFKKV
ncbi:MAG: GNAT family N-acetyltransferase [Acholeplasmataceae bacterium]